jgi:hypothetical protein
MSAMQDRDGAQCASPRGRGVWAALAAAPEFYRERREVPPSRVEAIFEPVVLLSAIGLFSLGAIQFGLAVAPSWPADGLLPLCIVAAAVGYFYSRRLARSVVIWREWLVLLLPLLLVARFLPYAFAPGYDLPSDVADWVAEPLSFFTLGFAGQAVLIVGAWTTAFLSAQDLADIRVQRGELPDAPARTIIERAWESDRIRAIDHTGPFLRLVGRFLQGGIALIVMAALTAANVRQLVTIEAISGLLAVGHPSSALALVDVLAYFVAVLLLMVEAQHVRTRALWTLDRVPVAPGLAAQWATAGVVLVAVGLVAALLAPTEGLLGLADIVHFVFALFFFVASYAMAGMYLVLWLLLYPLRWRLGGSSDAGPTTPPLQPPPAPPPTGGSSVFDAVKSLLFWAIFAAVLAYSFYALWRQGTLHRFVPGLAWLGEAAAKLLRALLDWLRALRRLAVRGATAIATAVRPLARRTPRVHPVGWLRGALPGRDPRRVVVATYTLVAARAAQRGVGRPPTETPMEYRVRLRAALPDVADDVDALTDTFLRARYSPRPVGQDDVGLVRRCWRRIRGGLRSARPA